MTQLTYNEAFDPYHAVFRLIRLHVACDVTIRLPFDTVRILDFYLLFPFRLQALRLFSQDTAWRKVSRGYEEMAPYGTMPDDNSLFSRMEPFHRAAVASLVRSGHLSPEAWTANEVQFTAEEIPISVTKRCVELNSRNADIIEILCELKARYPLLGRDGLKDRSGLLEFRYDTI